MKQLRAFILLSLLLPVNLLLCGCGKNQEAQGPPQAPASAPAPETNRPQIVAFGDSLTAGLGLSEAEAYPAQLQKLLDADGYQYKVVNAGVSGDTSSGGLRRIDWSLQGHPQFLILELGANDILRGQPIDLVRDNLSKIITRSQASGVTVLLAGMGATTSSGDVYREQVHDLYPDLAKQFNLTLIPFFLKEVFTTPAMLQSDGTHPNAKGARLVAESVFRSLKPLLNKMMNDE
jgi:acyl-CoA thioesterase-1